MTDDQQRQKRKTRGINSEKRAEALRKLKTLRQGGSTAEIADRYQIKIDEPIYDTVDEDEYESLVAKRQEDFRAFIVDDDGLGYADEGEEVDWTKSGVVPSSEEESEGELEKKKQKKTKTEKKDVKKPSFEAAAALMGKQRISNLFTSAVFNKNKPAVVSCDSILEDVLAEITPDENEKEKRRRSHKLAVRNNISVASDSLVTSVMTPPASVDRVVVGSNLSSNNLPSDILDKHEVFEAKETIDMPENGKDLGVVEEPEPVAVGTKVEEVKVESEVKVEPVVVKEADAWTLNAKIKEEKDPTFSASAGLQAVVSSSLSDDFGPGLNSDGKFPFVVDADGSMPFYMIDAYEEYNGSNAGNIYLFGKVFWLVYVYVRCTIYMLFLS